MASIMTNVAAMTALQALTATNKNLQTIQNEISTGYRVATAKDNAAYWSIATTMRSDNKALSTVSDALGLGSAQVDTAYTAMTSAKSVLDDIKSQLVAAKEPGIDKSKVQTQIAQDQQQLKGIADSATFSGSNWLSVDSSSSSYQATQNIVSSFSRDSNGNIQIGTIGVDITTTALFDANSAGGGLLNGTAGTGVASVDLSNINATNIDAGGTLQFSVAVNGTTQNVNVTVANPSNFTMADLVNGLNSGLSGAVASQDSSGNLVITSSTLGAASTIGSIQWTGATMADGTTSAAAAVGAVTDTGGSLGYTAGTNSGAGIMGIDITNASSAQLDAYISQVDTMSKNVISAASNLGAVQNRIGLQKTFVSNLMDAVTKGVGQLVDADMNQASTKLQALQVQQQLGIQALSIANSSSQSILSLFR